MKQANSNKALWKARGEQMSRVYKVEIPFEVSADNRESAGEMAITNLLEMLKDGVSMHVTPVSADDLIEVRRETPKAPGSEASNLNYVHVTRRDGTIFIPLPRESWRSAGRCDCDFCDGQTGYWDTLALAEVAPDQRSNDWTHTVHFPELHGAKKIKRR